MRQRTTGHAPADIGQAPTRNDAAPEDIPPEATQLRTENHQLRRAMRTRPVIDQARGIIMAVAHCSAEDAWRVLVEVSQHSNTKLHTVAEALVDTPEGPPLPEQLQREMDRAVHRRAPAARK
ncbi:ANTAR domain-containing protein [Streptomyces sp. ODS28]|uniref:ANTAR domain-containing protein n=1 Tax=Streptomyces sp. ODS28 TaxID=3136688 RepID=UPI0031EC037D